MSEKRLILVVEDERTISNFICRALNANDYKSIPAFSGKEGLSLFFSHSPDLVLLDLGLPDMDGMEILQELSGLPQETPVIIISARDRESEKVKALDMGADDYIVKPFGVSEMLARVRTTLRRSDRLRLSQGSQKDVYHIKDLTVVWPAPVSVIQDILISGPATDGTAVSLNNWTDGEWVSTTRYNAKPGYQVIRIDTDGQKKGDYSVFFVTNEATPVAAEGFYLYDVNLNVEIGAQDIGVMQSLPIEVYLTDSQGYRIDDVDFLQTLAVELEIVNQQNMGVEVEENSELDLLR